MFCEPNCFCFFFDCRKSLHQNSKSVKKCNLQGVVNCHSQIVTKTLKLSIHTDCIQQSSNYGPFEAFGLKFIVDEHHMANTGLRYLSIRKRLACKIHSIFSGCNCEQNTTLSPKILVMQSIIVY